MKKILLVVILLLIIFIVMSKHRLYVRDPLANVVRNGVKEDGAQVFINVDNDVLIENDSAPTGLYVELVHHDMPIGTPAKLTCMHWVACLADADQPKLANENDGTKIESMESKVVTFTDTDKRATVVTLR